jgi:tubulin polyglutamylase TTLL2
MKEYRMKTNGIYFGNLQGKSTLINLTFFRPTMAQYNAAKPYQKLIHFPKTGILCTKDSLARVLRRNKNMFGNVYNFSPKTFLLPNEYKKFIETFTRDENYSEQNRPIWICKPNDLSRGRGITIINDISNLQYDQASII